MTTQFLFPRYHRVCLILAMAAIVFPAVIAGQDSHRAAAVSPAEREIRQLAGWQLHISRQLLASEPKLTARAIELLQNQLEEIRRVVPQPAVAQLQQGPLFFSPTYPNSIPKAEYHPNVAWLREHGREPAMARAVEFSNIGIFEAETRRMPNFTLHELAHAYHHRVLDEGYDHPAIQAAFQKAKESGRYDRVERWFGNGKPNTFEKSYAMSSPMEYFAESSEAYFSRNDFFPFTREELRRHDPEMFALVRTLWESPDQTK
jgi:hypothetical protein